MQKKEDWNNGILEYWSKPKGKTFFQPIVPLFHHSIGFGFS